VITLAAYAIGLGCITLALRHRLTTWAVIHTTRSRLFDLIEPRSPERDASTTLANLARSLRSGLTLRASLIADANQSGSLLPPTIVARLNRGDILREVCRDELTDCDGRVRRAIELADISGLNAADILDIAADSIREEESLALLAHSAGSHARSTIAVLTGCSLLALTLSFALSEGVRGLIGSPLGIVLVLIGLGCNVAARVWINREVHRSTSGNESARHARDLVLTLECLVLSGYSLQGALMTVHTWLQERSALFTHAAELLHFGHTVETALSYLERTVDVAMRPVVHGLRLAHHDGGPVQSSLASLRTEITRAEEHRLTSAIQRTPVRLVIPLVVCGLPSFLCIGVIPVLVAILGGLTTTNGG
jgi:tight adherence protein B